MVVDNASSDGSRAYLEDRFPEVDFTWNAVNTGFSKANNQALLRARGEFILFLNPDTIVPEDCFENCLRFMDSHADAGALGIRMIDGTGKYLRESKRAFPSPATAFYKLTGLTSLFPASPVFGRYHLGHLDHRKNQQIDVLAGAFMLVRKSVLDIAGGFDEVFFMYGEDIDLSYRILQTGYKNYYFAENTIIHFKGESTKKGSLNYVTLFYKAMTIFVHKHFHGVKADLFNLFIHVAIWLRAMVSLLIGLIRKIGLPLIDAGLILLSFWAAKIGWNKFFKPEVMYSRALLTVAFPFFTALFLIAAYYTGLYDRRQKKGQLIRSTLIAILIILAFYSLLPEQYRFSRAILLCGSFIAFLGLSMMRMILKKWGVIEPEEKQEYLQTVIVGTEMEYNRILGFMKSAEKEGRILGRIALEDDSHEHLATIGKLDIFLRDVPVREIIFCENGLSFKQIIALTGSLQGGIRVRISASGSQSMVGSDSKDSSGEIIAPDLGYKLADPVQRRLKRLIDLTSSIVFLMSFPVHLFGVAHPLSFFRNCFAVIGGNKTWIGYYFPEEDLPAIRPGVLGSNGLPARRENLQNREALKKVDRYYAKEYSPYLDLGFLWKAYHFLGG
jgi:GT2 family glycosyltransferase